MRRIEGRMYNNHRYMRVRGPTFVESLALLRLSAVDRSAAVGRALVQIAMSAISIRRRLSRRASEADAVIDSQAWGIGAIRDFSEHR